MRVTIDANQNFRVGEGQGSVQRAALSPTRWFAHNRRIGMRLGEFARDLRHAIGAPIVNDDDLQIGIGPRKGLQCLSE